MEKRKLTKKEVREYCKKASDLNDDVKKTSKYMSAIEGAIKDLGHENQKSCPAKAKLIIETQDPRCNILCKQGYDYAVLEATQALLIKAVLDIKLGMAKIEYAKQKSDLIDINTIIQYEEIEVIETLLHKE